MLRRMQLMEPERRSLLTRLGDAAAGLRDGLLRDNKVLPPVLAALALVIFAWVLAGVIIGDPEEDRVARQAAQPSFSQAPDDGSAPPSDTPAPGVENRDSESLDVYESKDPFRELIPTADATDDAAAGEDTTGGTADPATPSVPGASDGSGSDSTDGTGDDAGSGDGGSGGSGTGSGDGSGGSGSGQYGGGGQDDFLDQTSPGDPGFDDGSGSGGGNGDGSGSGDGGSSGAGSGGGAGQYGGDGNGDLFDSGGNLRR